MVTISFCCICMYVYKHKNRHAVHTHTQHIDIVDYDLNEAHHACFSLTSQSLPVYTTNLLLASTVYTADTQSAAWW